MRRSTRAAPPIPAWSMRASIRTCRFDLLSVVTGGNRGSPLGIGRKRLHLAARTAQFVREAARDSALSIEVKVYVPLATRDFTTIVDTLSKNPPDGVLMLLGNDAVSFSRAFCEAGLTRAWSATAR